MNKNVYLIDLDTGTARSPIPLGCSLISSYAQTQPDINKEFDIEILMLEDTLEMVLDHLTMGGETKLLKKSPTRVIKHHVHNFSDRIEFNRRRVSSTHTLNLSNVTFINKGLRTWDYLQSKVPNARNVNMTGEFI